MSHSNVFDMFCSKNIKMNGLSNIYDTVNLLEYENMKKDQFVHEGYSRYSLYQSLLIKNNRFIVLLMIAMFSTVLIVYMPGCNSKSEDEKSIREAISRVTDQEASSTAEMLSPLTTVMKGKDWSSIKNATHTEK